MVAVAVVAVAVTVVVVMGEREVEEAEVTGDGGAAEAGAGDVVAGGSSTDPMVAVYRHDVHKLRGRSHEAAVDEWLGVAVNEPVPFGADGDAALLSRPSGEPERTVANHASPSRLSLVTGAPVGSAGAVDTGGREVRALVASTDPERLHAAWLASRVAAGFNESVYYPYTSLKYHTLLVGALVAAYRDGYGFDDLFLAVTPGTGAELGAEAADSSEVVSVTGAGHSSRVVESFVTVLWSSAVAVHVTPEPGGWPAVRVGRRPSRSFGDVWGRVPEYPFDVDGERRWRVLDAQLRRIGSWSTALQFMEDVLGRGGRWGDVRVASDVWVRGAPGTVNVGP